MTSKVFIKEVKTFEDSHGKKHNSYAEAAVMSLAYEIADNGLDRAPSDSTMGIAKRIFDKRQSITAILDEIKDNLP